MRGGRALRVCEIPIAFRERARGKSKMSLGIALRFSLRWLHAMSLHLVRRPFRVAEIGRSTMSKVPID
jgi:hypothetical protein